MPLLIVLGLALLVLVVIAVARPAWLPGIVLFFSGCFYLLGSVYLLKLLGAAIP